MLTIQSTDQALPGGTPRSDLLVRLLARSGSGIAGVGSKPRPSLRFGPPRPNPLSHETWFSFDLPEDALVSLEIFDLGGRRVASLASGVENAGHHQLRWDATTGNGPRIAGGLYFARFITRGLSTSRRIVVLP